MASEDTIEPTRVMLWCVPRTISTVLTKCMSFVKSSQIVVEPFNSAYHFGPEKIQSPAALAARWEAFDKLQQQRLQNVKIEGLAHVFEDDQCTYAWVKGQLEAEYRGKSLIFCKDHAYGLQGKYEMIPKGYKHTFLIRHPYKVFISWRKLLYAHPIFPQFGLCNAPECMFPSKYGFMEQFELYQYIKANVDPSPIILDADDLLSNPKSVVEQYCSGVGIPFSDSLLEWPSSIDVIKKWKAARSLLHINMLQQTGGFLDAALHSSRFNPPKEMPSVTELPEDVIPCVEASMPCYQQMYEMRLKPEV
ncbi:uncharacterized protein [Amphiura filiformis]|uniref:uncharacterized protein n=1 Tax=Amphiura filiformis TaxID=82378 RepID=UPI003B21EA79